MVLETETFWSLLHNRAHWEFELFMQVVVDGLIIGIGWGWMWKHVKHHLDRDKREGVK